MSHEEGEGKEDSTDFGNAFPSTTLPTAEAASWNPALRRNSEAPVVAESDDDFFDRYPGATPKKNNNNTSSKLEEAELLEGEDEDEDEEVDEDDDEDSEPESPIRRQSISVQHTWDVSQSDAMTTEEMSRVPSHNVEVEGPMTRNSSSSYEEEDEEVLLRPEESVEQQRQALEESMPELEGVEATQEVGGGVQQVDHAAEAGFEQGSSQQAEHYEHQGEVTEIEEAIEPSAEIPLMEDEEPSPTITREPAMGIPTRESTLSFDGVPTPPRKPQSNVFVAPTSMARSFTTNFAESPIEARQPQLMQQSQPPIPEDWPSVGDDRTFGELLDSQDSSSREQEVLEEVAAQDSAQMAAPDLSTAEITAFEQEPAHETEQVASEDDDLLLEDDGEIKEEDLAAAWGAAIDDDELLDEMPTTGFDPSDAFGDDDEGFLTDEPPAPVQVQQRQPQQQQRSAQPDQYRSAYSQQIPQQQNQYSPQLLSQGFHGRSAGTPSTGLHDLYNQPGALQQQQPQAPPQRPQAQTAQSFVDKAKGGYQSPYDLPMDVVKPRRRPNPLHQQQPAQSPVPPPRSSSMTSNLPTLARAQPQPQALPQRTGTAGSIDSLSPPPSSHSGGSAQPMRAFGAPTALAKSTNTPNKAGGGGGFFEDLPMATVKSRARPTTTYTPQAQPQPLQSNMGMPTPPPSLSMAPLAHPSRPPPPTQQASVPSLYNSGLGLSRPEQLPLLPDQPDQPGTRSSPPQNLGGSTSTRYSPSGNLPAPMAPPAVQNRYSPAPGATSAAASRYSSAPSMTAQPPTSTARYSPAPGAQPAQAKHRLPSLPSNAPSTLHAFAPRTSSPLAAMIDKPHPPLLPPEAKGMQPPPSPPKTNGIRAASVSPPSISRSRYAPLETSSIMHPPTTFAPPQRPRTQSPDTTMKGPRSAIQQQLTRPNSSAGLPSQQQQQQQNARRPAVLAHRRQFSRDLIFAAPQDERGQDPLERWKGYPIFKWNAAGTVISSFPKQTPFYAAGQGIPSVKCTPGAIKVEDAAAGFMPMEERNARFPGPLTARSKRQKKDLVAWLGGKIEDLERVTEGAMLDYSMEADLRKRVEEKLVLWKIMRVFVENDGVLEGSAKIEEEVRRVLLPNLAQMAQVVELQSPLGPGLGSAAAMPADPVDKQVVFQIRQALLEGQRERAVWLAEEKKLWGHAMLISSTMGPETWKQIVQAFVRSQVKSVGSDARSTAALYQVFAGNAEECVDELVPPSARAGYQMISKADGTVSGNPLEGLDQWRETLGLVTSNRTPSDGPSLLALGKLLSSYGRVEAAHTCFLFARGLTKHSGADDAEAHLVLLGANHESRDERLGSDLDSILLTEVYEYASSLSAPSTAVNYSPHLQAYKLLHAQELAAHGLKTQAQAYCDHITSAYTSTTRPSPYYHPTFTQAVADFSAFLSQTPHDGKLGFFSKPAMNKVSSGAASWFTKFVAGDDDQLSNGSGPGGAGSEDMAGPFGRVNGETPPSISRTTSTTNLYDPMMGGGGGVPIPGMAPAASQSFMSSSAPSKYTPGHQSAQPAGGKYAPGQPYSSLGMPAAEPQRPSSSRYAPAPSTLGVPRATLSRRASDQSLPYAPNSRRGSAQDTTSSQGSYEPRPILADDSSIYSYSPVIQSPMVQPQQAPAVQEPEAEILSGMLESVQAEEEGGQDVEIAGDGYAPPTGGYEPPSYSYQPYEPEPDSPEEAKPKKKQTFGDDEDEDSARTQRAATLKKAQADRAADDAFRRAAEADAARDSDKANAKKGWMAGWWGKKDPNAAPGPIRAKLGDENSFYYDEKLKKWVNKKGGPETATPVAATPPPPRGPPSRVASTGMMGPPSGPISRASSDTGGVGLPGRPNTSGSNAAFSGPPSGPPSRIGTPASSPPSELFAHPSTNGDAPAALSATPSLGPPIRPSSSLSTASSIDDLLAGPPGARKGGTIKKGKKGGRYIDVMAK